MRNICTIANVALVFSIPFFHNQDICKLVDFDPALAYKIALDFALGLRSRSALDLQDFGLILKFLDFALVADFVA